MQLYAQVFISILHTLRNPEFFFFKFCFTHVAITIGWKLFRTIEYSQHYHVRNYLVSTGVCRPNRSVADGHAIRRRVPNEMQMPNVVSPKSVYDVRKRFYKPIFFSSIVNTGKSDNVRDIMGYTKNINLLRPVWQREPFDLARCAPTPFSPIMCRQHCQQSIVRYSRCYGINTCFVDS